LLGALGDELAYGLGRFDIGAGLDRTLDALVERGCGGGNLYEY
jgi:hypothetical protein